MSAPDNSIRICIQILLEIGPSTILQRHMIQMARILLNIRYTRVKVCPENSKLFYHVSHSSGDANKIKYIHQWKSFRGYVSRLRFALHCTPKKKPETAAHPSNPSKYHFTENGIPLNQTIHSILTASRH